MLLEGYTQKRDTLCNNWSVVFLLEMGGWDGDGDRGSVGESDSLMQMLHMLKSSPAQKSAFGHTSQDSDYF